MIFQKTTLDKAQLKSDVIETLKTIFDPEIPVNIYDLGLIYQVDISDDAEVFIQMTLTTPGCPVAQTFPGTVENKVREMESVSEASVELVWDPPWTQDCLSDAAKVELGFL